MSHGALTGQIEIMWLYILHNSSMYGPAGVKPFRVAKTTT